MIIPSIDVMDSRAVQLIGGEKKAIDAGDPIQNAEKLAVAGEIAVIDLNAARGEGTNEPVIKELVRRFPCRVGGGIRDVESAVQWLDRGATKVILGTAAEAELLAKLPKERVIAALDARHGEVVVEGWLKGTGRGVLERIAELKDVVGGFLVTSVEREGRMKGIDLKQVEEVVWKAEGVRVTVAGGVTTAEQIAAIDGLGADAQVGMAIYSGKLPLADAIVAPMKSDRPDGLWATLVTDELGNALGLVWSDLESVREAVATRRGVYRSRSRGLWIKGLTSGNCQELLRIDLDCDRDAMRFFVRQEGEGFCHTGAWSCWGPDGGLRRLWRRLHSRTSSAPEGSYTRRLLDDRKLLNAKLTEEAGELAHAKPDEVAQEAADLFYHALVAIVRAGVDLAEVEAELDRRSRQVTRRRTEKNDSRRSD